MSATGWIAAAHAAVTLALTGLIWFVQVVHYPLFARVGEREFATYAAAHVRATSRIVAPLMLAEVATAGWLFWAPPPGAAWATSVGIALVVVLWLSTALLQVPCHRRLASGLDQATVRRLVLTNWLRTAAWTGRTGLALWLLIVSVRPE